MAYIPAPTSEKYIQKENNLHYQKSDHVWQPHDLDLEHLPASPLLLQGKYGLTSFLDVVSVLTDIAPLGINREQPKTSNDSSGLGETGPTYCLPKLANHGLSIFCARKTTISSALEVSRRPVIMGGEPQRRTHVVFGSSNVGNE